MATEPSPDKNRSLLAGLRELEQIALIDKPLIRAAIERIEVLEAVTHLCCNKQTTPSHALPSRESDRPNLAAAIALHELHGSLPSTTRLFFDENIVALARRCGWGEVQSRPLECFLEDAVKALETTASATACSADAKDAARYRYMRSSAGFQDRNGPGLYWYLPRWNAELPMGERLDAAIDAALRRPDGGKQA